MIGIDWGTTSFRAFRLRGRTVLERREAAAGITGVAPGGFEGALRGLVGDWLATEHDVLMSGMVGSRQGWVEAAYLPCPVGTEALAGALTTIAVDGARVAVVPGLSADAGGTPEVMRGEETQLAGLGLADAAVCLPGTHSKWARLEAGRIAGFATHMTGEVFAALRGHTILGRLMEDAPGDDDAFLRGHARSREPGGLLHHLFGVRTLGLFDRLAPAQAASYLSGLLIGHELAAAAPAGVVHLIGTPALCRLYALALRAAGVESIVAPPDLAAAGLATIAERAGWR